MERARVPLSTHDRLVRLYCLDVLHAQGVSIMLFLCSKYGISHTTREAMYKYFQKYLHGTQAWYILVA